MHKDYGDDVATDCFNNTHGGQDSHNHHERGSDSEKVLLCAGVRNSRKEKEQEMKGEKDRRPQNKKRLETSSRR